MNVQRFTAPLVMFVILGLLLGITFDQSETTAGAIRFLVAFATITAIYAIFALGLNVQWGYTGIFNFGIAAFFLVGAYTAAIFVKQPADPETSARYVGGFGEVLSPPILGADQWLPFLVAILAAAVISGLLALLLAGPTLRLREDYLAITTIGLAEFLRRVVIEEDGLVNGTRVLVNIPKPYSGYVDGDAQRFVFLGVVLAVLALVFILVERSIRSPWGRVLRALKEDEVATAASGKNVFAFRMQGFVFGAMIMGIGGAMFAFRSGAIGPTTFDHFLATFIFWAMLIAGGSGNNWGAVSGAFVIWGFYTISLEIKSYDIPQVLASRIDYIRNFILGALIVAVLILSPRGLIPEERRVSLWLDRHMRQKEPEEP